MTTPIRPTATAAIRTAAQNPIAVAPIAWTSVYPMYAPSM